MTTTDITAEHTLQPGVVCVKSRDRKEGLGTGFIPYME